PPRGARALPAPPPLRLRRPRGAPEGEGRAPRGAGRAPPPRSPPPPRAGGPPQHRAPRRRPPLPGRARPRPPHAGLRRPQGRYGPARGRRALRGPPPRPRARGARRRPRDDRGTRADVGAYPAVPASPRGGVVGRRRQRALQDQGEAVSRIAGPPATASRAV